MSGETVSTKALQDWLRTRILSTVVGGGTVDAILSGRLYWDRPPADATYPFGVLRGPSSWRNPGAYRGERKQGTLELMLIARPADNADVDALNLAADRAEGAMMFARVGDSTPATSGLIFVGEATRDPLPPPTEPVDEQTYQIRILWVVTAFVRYLTQVAHP